MNDSRPLIAVTGDLVLDCHLYGGVKTGATSFGEPETIYREREGGATLMHELLQAAALAEAVAPAHAKMEAAEKTQARLAERAREGGCADAELAAAADAFENAIKGAIAAKAGGNKWAVALGVRSRNELPPELRSYGVWTPRPSRKGSKDRVWRVERHFGYGPATRGDSAAQLEQQALDRAPNLTIVDDGAILFRHRRSERAWPSVAGDGHLILKMSAPLLQGDLWTKLVATEATRDRLIVVVSAADLRQMDVQISRRLSWERSAEDTLEALASDPIARQLCNAAHLVVTFEAEAAIWLRRGSDGSPAARLLYAPDQQEGDHARDIEGTAYGFATSFVAGLGHELMRRHVAASSSDPSPFDDHAAMERAMEQGIASGLHGRRRLLELGHGPVGGKNPGFPLRELGEALAQRGGGFVAVEVPPSSHRPPASRWTILRQSEGISAAETPLTGLATLAARFGSPALSHLPALRLGDVFTVDRSEIESLRALERLVRTYEEGAVQKKPLSIGVFGPPGAGKSFAVKALATAILGSKVPFLEFNLSQFASPDELIGALHRVRDEVLRGITPVAFWDEFDSQRYKWLQYLLAPMQDGAFQEGQITHAVGKCVFIFAGGTSPTRDAFGPAKPPGDATADEKADYKKEAHDFRMVKGPDFLSRLHGHLDVLGPNPHDDEECPDITWPIRRALLLRALLGSKEGEELDVDPGLLYALLSVPKYSHGTRSFEKIVQALKQGRIDGRLQRSALPPAALLARDTDTSEFYRRMRERDAFRSHPDIECLAAAAHERFRTTTRVIAPEVDKPYANLDADLQISNRAMARRIPDHLALIDFEIEPASDGDDLAWSEALEKPLVQHIERLAQAEHLGWCQERRANGWIYAEARDNPLKHHPSLVEWSRLSATDRDKDRENIRSIPELLKLAKYKAVRKGAP